jgi:hypothetical protein
MKAITRLVVNAALPPFRMGRGGVLQRSITPDQQAEEKLIELKTEWKENLKKYGNPGHRRAMISEMEDRTRDYLEKIGESGDVEAAVQYWQTLPWTELRFEYRKAKAYKI